MGGKKAGTWFLRSLTKAIPFQNQKMDPQEAAWLCPYCGLGIGIVGLKSLALRSKKAHLASCSPGTSLKDAHRAFIKRFPEVWKRPFDRKGKLTEAYTSPTMTKPGSVFRVLATTLSLFATPSQATGASFV